MTRRGRVVAALEYCIRMLGSAIPVRTGHREAESFGHVWFRSHQNPAGANVGHSRALGSLHP
jgi:hypothetical protein